MRYLLLLIYCLSMSFSADAEALFGRITTCQNEMHLSTHQSIEDWFLSEIKSLIKDNPQYSEKTVFVTQLPVSYSWQCGTRAKKYLEIIRNSVIENRKNQNNPEYIPTDVDELIRLAKENLRIEK